MVINRKLIVFYISILCTYIANADNKILVERYEKWDHPVLKVFKKYGISVYKISFSKDGTCPTFYATFRQSPDPRAPDAGSFEKVYHETLVANSFFPYALVDEEENIRINVGWEDRGKRIYKIDMDKANTISLCNKGK